tara:strand:- start:61466 stop:62110 length:645 start_codon:yes stop_codon:yes gene_type:complete
MKKYVLLVATTLIFGTSTMIAQDVKLGAKAGVNFAKLSGEALEDADGRTGFHVGFLAEIPLSERFAIQPELVYSQQGLQSKESFDGTEFETKVKLDYLNVPVMAKFYLIDGLSIEAGPQFGFNINAKQELEVTGGDTDGDFEITGEDDIKDEVSGFDLGIGGGLAYQLDNGLFFQGRYIYGLSNVPEDVDDAQGEDVEDDLVNSVLSLSVGFKF